MMSRRRQPEQLLLSFDEEPGKKRRPGKGKRLGRPRKPNAGVSHLRREDFSPRHPVHVTLKVQREVGNLRSARLYGAVERSIALARDRHGARLVHFSVQDDHIHLVVEAGGKAALAQAVQALCVRIARQLNRARGVKGRVFADRYHRRVMTTPTHVHNTLAYVLLNGQKHGYRNPEEMDQDIDDRSSGAWFTGWKERRAADLAAQGRRARPIAPVVEARTWLLREGWRRVGPISMDREPRCPW
ncbi:MAG: transposase [Acidobacteriota bacterium]